MSTVTTNYQLNKPEVGGDAAVWATLLNENWDSLDALIKSIADSFAVFSLDSAGLVPAPEVLHGYFLKDDGSWSLVDPGVIDRGSLDLNAFVIGSPTFDFGSEGCQRIFADFLETKTQILAYQGGEVSFVPYDPIAQSLYKSNSVVNITNNVNVSVASNAALNAAAIGDTAIRIRCGGTYNNTDNTPTRSLTFAFYFNNTLIAERTLSGLEVELGARHWYLDACVLVQSNGVSHRLSGNISLASFGDDITQSYGGPVNGGINVALGVNNIFDIRARHDTADVATLTRNFLIVTQE